MAKATFVGDPNDDNSGPDTIEVGGKVYTKDKAVTVDDKTAEKLAGNSHFEVSGLKRKSEAPDAETDTEATVFSTTGDPETASRETMESQDSDDATDPLKQPV